MKLASTILLFWISILTVQPAFAGVCRALTTENCCAGESCGKESKEPCKQNDDSNCCMNGVCNPCAACYCCIGGTMEKNNIQFISTSQKINLTATQNQNALSGFLSSPFQPPEIVSFN